MTERTAPELLDDLKYIFQFSVIFYESFGFKEDRVRLWRFLTILLELEDKGTISTTQLFNSREIAELTQFKGSKYYWVDEFIKGFRNDTGSFLTPISKEAEAKKRVYRLNTQFNAAVAQYVTLFLQRMRPAGTAAPKEMSESRSKEIFKRIHNFQVMKYWPTWKLLLDEMSVIAHSYNSKARFREKFDHHIVYGVVVMIFMKQHLIDSESSLDIFDVSKETNNVMSTSDPKEIINCLQFLSVSNGCQVLEVVRHQGQRRWRLNPAYKNGIMAYLAKLKALRDELTSLVTTTLQNGEPGREAHEGPAAASRKLKAGR